MNLIRRCRWPLLILIIGLICAEAAVRLAGITDFPLYNVSADIGYIPKPAQSGRFLNKNDWVFNDKSMGTAQNWDPKNRDNILLIGNSIIMGGNPYAQKDKIAALVQNQLSDRQTLWPIATGGWTVVNETVYMEQHPEVTAAANFFIWEYMRGELGQLSAWRGTYVFPDRAPPSALWYAIRRYVLPRFIDFNMDELPPVGSTNQDHLRRFEQQIALLVKSVGHPQAGVLLLYPTEQELVDFRAGREWLPERALVEQIAARYGVTVIDVAKNPAWNAGLYRDGVHPTLAGNIVLAKIIADTIHVEHPSLHPS